MSTLTCPTCSPLRHDLIGDASGIPDRVRPAKDSATPLAAWAAKDVAVRVCADCGTGWAVFENHREGYWEVVELPGAVLALLRDSCAPGPVAAALATHEQSRRWTLLGLRFGHYPTQTVFDALADAMSAPELTAEQLQRLLLGWQELVARLADGASPGVDPRADKLLDALDRDALFATPQNAGRLKNIEDCAQQMASRLFAARSKFVVSSSLQARWNARLSPHARSGRALADVPAGTTPPDEASGAQLQRELLVLKDEAWVGWDRTPNPLVAKLLGAYVAMQAWAPQAQPGSAAGVVLRDLKALLLALLRNDRVSLGLVAPVMGAVDPNARLLLNPASFCAQHKAPLLTVGCKRCDAFNQHSTQIPGKLEALLPGARADVQPLFVGGSWLPAKSNDSMAICPDCGTLLWRYASAADPTPALHRLGAHTRCLVESRPYVGAILAFIASPDYHRDRLAGARTLAWRLCERGWGCYDGKELAQGLMDSLLSDVMCGDVLADCVDLLVAIVKASAEAVEGGWPQDSRVVVEDESLLRDLAHGTRPLPHVDVRHQGALRAHICVALQTIQALR